MVVSFVCHIEGSIPVPSGQPRSISPVPQAGRPSLDQRERIPRMCRIRMRSQVQVLAGPPRSTIGQSVVAGGAVRVPALDLVHVAPCWVARRSSHQERQAAHGQQSHTQGDGQQQPKTRTRGRGRRSTTMGSGSCPAGIGRCDGGGGRSTLQPIGQRSATESLHQVSALAQAFACR